MTPAYHLNVMFCKFLFIKNLFFNLPGEIPPEKSDDKGGENFTRFCFFKLSLCVER